MDNHNLKFLNGSFVNRSEFGCEFYNSKSYHCNPHASKASRQPINFRISEIHTGLNSPIDEICRTCINPIKVLEDMRRKLLNRLSMIIKATETLTEKLLKQYETAIKNIKISYYKFKSFSNLSAKDSDTLISFPYRILDLTLNKKLNAIYKQTKAMLSDSENCFPDVIMNLFHTIKSDSIPNNKKLALLKKTNNNIDTEKVTAIAAKLSQNLIVYGTENSTVHYFHAYSIGNQENPKSSGREASKSNPIKVIEITKHGKAAIIGTQQGQVLIFDLIDKTFTNEYKTQASVYGISSSKNGDVAFQDFNYNLTIITEQGRTHTIEANNLNNTRSNLIKFSPNGEWVFLAKNGDHAVQYSLVNKSIKNLWHEERVKINFIEVSKIAPFVAVCSSKIIKVYDYSQLNNHKPAISHQSKKDITFASFTKMNKNFCFFGYSKGILLFTLPSKEPRKLKTKWEIMLCIQKYPELIHFSSLIKF